MSDILHAYQVTVRRKRDRQEQLLGNFNEAGADLLNVFDGFLLDLKLHGWLDPEVNAAARVDEVFEPDEANRDIIGAMIKSGEMGVASEIVTTAPNELRERVAFRRQREHAELVPVLVLAKLPGTRTKGFLITHSPNGRGVKTRLWDELRTWFGKRFPDFKIELDPVFPSRFYQKVIEEERLKQVTLIRQLKPSDMADEDRRWFDERNLGTVRIVIAPRGRLPYLRKNDVIKVLQKKGRQIAPSLPRRDL
jgi:hypothetical protein